MRQKFVQCAKFAEAFEECPWTNEIVRVYGGFMCFESESDFQIWNNQK